MRTVEFLDAVKRRHDLPSDYAISKHFGWRISRVYEYRGGHRELDDEACVQVAESLDLPPPYVMACIAAARAKDATIRKYWTAAAKLLKTGTAAAILATAVSLSQTATPPSSVDGFNQLYIMRRSRKTPEGGTPVAFCAV